MKHENVQRVLLAVFPLLDQRQMSQVDCVNKINARVLSSTGSFNAMCIFLPGQLKEIRFESFCQFWLCKRYLRIRL